jgi:hypothetical protein
MGAPVADKAAGAHERKLDSMDEHVAAREKWTGEWFIPVVGSEYRIPANAGNYMKLRGMTGECVDYTETAHGHVWAGILFQGEEKPRAIRTCYLVAVIDNPDDMKRPQPEKSGENPIDHLKRAWEGPSNSGTVGLSG